MTTSSGHGPGSAPCAGCGTVLDLAGLDRETGRCENCGGRIVMDERYFRERRGGMAYPSAIIDPETGELLNTDDPALNTEGRRRQRLRAMEAMRRLRVGDEEGYRRLMSGEDPDESP